MKCPVCQTPDLLMADRQGIEVDYCPQCRGVWLDRGELDKLIERSAVQAGPEPFADERGREGYPYEPERRYDDDAHGRYPGSRHGRKRRGGFLGELFDFD